MWEPDVPVLPDVEVPQESDYEDRDEYLEALAEYESEVSEYRENMKKLDAEIDAGRVRKYALIGMLDAICSTRRFRSRSRRRPTTRAHGLYVDRSASHCRGA